MRQVIKSIIDRISRMLGEGYLAEVLRRVVKRFPTFRARACDERVSREVFHARGIAAKADGN
jgi:hypothetical protein